VLMAHPYQRARLLAFVLGTIAMILPACLELLGVLPDSYAFEAGRMSILPQVAELPRLPTSVFLIVASFSMMIVPCVFIHRLRAALNEAQVQLMVQAWHLKQLAVHGR
jgi:hypothetical protein